MSLKNAVYAGLDFWRCRSWMAAWREELRVWRMVKRPEVFEVHFVMV